MTVLSNIITPTNVLTASSTNTLTNKTWNSNTIGVAYGGTGLSTTTAYSVVFTGTTATGNFQASAGPGTSGQVLTSNGAGALPTFQSPAASGATIGLARAISINCILP